ncbi:DUF6377 domain-containing protein [Chitinophagaceae bacterium LWZ2-11]
MKYLITCFCFFICLTAGSQVNTDSLLNALTKTINRTGEYDAQKLQTITALKLQLSQTNPAKADEGFELTRKIYEEYKVFNYDSAYIYAVKLQAISRHMPGAEYAAAAKMKLCFILLSAGLYKETYDSLSTIKITRGRDSLKAEFYTLWARYYYDLAGYANDNYHSIDYDVKGSVYLDSALAYYPQGSFDLAYYTGLRFYKQNKTKEAATYFQAALDKPELSYHQLALAASTLSSIYLQQDNINKTIELLATATDADIKSSTKETVAIFHLAELLYKMDDLKHAAICIENAIASADFYGARQRKLQAGSILPQIDGKRINAIEAQRSLLFRYAIGLTVLVVLLLLLAYIILQQVRKLKRAKETITKAHHQQQAANILLEESNKKLAEANEKLEEANKIKEEYIGYFFNMDSRFYEKLDKIKTTLENKLSERKYDEIRFFLNKIEAKKEKEELLLNFDKLFLKLFPHFVAEVNALLHPEDQIHLRDGELLNTDLRIFALIRMGVSDTEKIAQILEYSVKTIYSYKTKMKNKSIVPNEEFEKRIMEIKTM